MSFFATLRKSGILLLALAVASAAGVAFAADSAPKVETIDDANDQPAQTLYIALSPVAGASGYDVQIRPVNQHWSEPYSFRMTGTQLRVRLTPEKYEVRTRAFDDDGNSGEWSDWRQFQIEFKSPDHLYPQAGAIIEPAGAAVERILFQWPKSPQAGAYLFRLRDGIGKPIRIVRTNGMWMPTEVKVTSKYSWCVVPLTDIHAPDPGEGACKYLPFTVVAPSLTHQEVTVEADTDKDAAQYEFEFVRFKNQTETTEPSIFDSGEPTLRTELASGEYEMRVRKIYDDSERSEWSAPKRFFIKLPTPKIVTPADQVISPDEYDGATVDLKWQKVDGASHYTVYIFDKDGKLLQRENTNETHLSVKLPESSSFRWHVVAYNPREPERSLASVEPDVNRSAAIKTEEYIKLDLAPAEEPSHFYGWVRAFESNAHYASTNYDYNTLINQGILGGGTDLGLGYWDRRSRLGLLVSAGVSGYRTTSTTAVFSNIGLLLGKRFVFSDSHRLRVWAGVSYNEVPEIIANLDTMTYTVQRVPTYGPQVQLSWTGAFTPTLGWHVFGSGYYGLGTTSTPNGMSIIPTLSYNFSVFGTYKLSHSILGMAGYTFRRDAASYSSADPLAAGPNATELTGHYFSIAVEFGLVPPKK